MEENGAMTVIAHIESQFHTKFGIPRQSGLVEELEADVVFEPSFGTSMRCGGWKDFPISGLSGTFPRSGTKAGRPLSGRPDWGETADWEFLPPGPPFVQTLSA